MIIAFAFRGNQLVLLVPSILSGMFLLPYSSALPNPAAASLTSSPTSDPPTIVHTAAPRQCVSLRDTLLSDPNPYRHLNARNLPPLDAELLVSMAFSLIPHLPADMMDEIAQHPFSEEPIPGG